MDTFSLMLVEIINIGLSTKLSTNKVELGIHCSNAKLN